jgi:L-ascorbate metabolism protein UlaG (beta-lactamase superfamily)
VKKILNEPQTLSRLAPNSHLTSPLGYSDVFDGIGMRNRTALDWYDVYRDGNISITLLPCNHWTMRTPIQGPNRALWGSFLITTASGHTIYLSGEDYCRSFLTAMEHLRYLMGVLF